MNKFMKQIWDGQYSSEKQSYLACIEKQFNSNLRSSPSGSEKVNGTLRSCKTNLERVKVVEEFYQWIPPNLVDVKKYQKSDELASKFRQLGNDFYRNQCFKQAIHGYNIAAIFAFGRRELALAFANRSAVFLEISQPLLALLDIQKAESLDYPEDLLPKLLQRKEKCSRLLETKIQLESHLSQSQVNNLVDDELNLSEEMKKRKQYCEDELFALKNRSTEITSAENFIAINENMYRGRHVVATEDVQPGTVIIVDVPFAKILLRELRWDLEHCHYCHKPNIFGVPCNDCAFAYYCSEKCRDSAIAEYHQYECQCFPTLHLLKIPRTALLAFRIVCKLGPKHLRQVFVSTINTDTPIGMELSPAPEQILGFENQVYDSCSYLPIFNLISHPDKLETSELISYCLTSLTLVSILESQSSFFENLSAENPEEHRNRFKTFVASIILLHMQNLPPNAHSLNELKNISQTSPCDREAIKHAEVQEYGAGAFALLSLINHSCNPNVFRVNSYNGKTAVITLRGLKAGEEVLDNYGVHFAIDEKDSRKKHLLENYYFDCSCLACFKNWPLYKNLKDMKEYFLCNLCCAQFDVTNVSRKCEYDYKEKFMLKNNSNCPNCKTNFNKLELARNLNMKIDKFFLAYNSVMDNDPLAVLNTLKQTLQYFDSHVLPPFCRANDTQETFKQALNLIIYFSTFRC